MEKMNANLHDPSNVEHIRSTINAIISDPILVQGERPLRPDYLRPSSAPATSRHRGYGGGIARAPVQVLNLEHVPMPSFGGADVTALLGSNLVRDFYSLNAAAGETRLENMASMSKYPGTFPPSGKRGPNRSDEMFGLDRQSGIYRSAEHDRAKLKEKIDVGESGGQMEEAIKQVPISGNGNEGVLENHNHKHKRRSNDSTESPHKKHKHGKGHKHKEIRFIQEKQAETQVDPADSKAEKVSFTFLVGESKRQVLLGDMANDFEPGIKRRHISLQKITTATRITEGVEVTPPENERNDEWLGYTGSDFTSEDADADDLHGKNPRDTRSESDIMMKEISLLFKVLKWSGRMPFVIKQYNGFCKFYVDRSSWNYVMYCISSIIITVIAASMLCNFLLILHQRASSFYRKVEALQFDKYWEFGFITLINLWYIVISSLSTILTGSFHLGEFLTRWNLCLNIMHYDTSHNLKYMISKELMIFVVYSIIVCGSLLMGDLLIDWNETFGFVAQLVFRLWIPKLRLSKYYRLLQWIGLVIHLYSIFASRMLTLLVTVYCRALENAARWWNYRLVGVLGSVCKVGKNGKRLLLKRMIPYTTLIAEHLVVTSFSKQIGRVFAIILTAFVMTRAFCMLTTSYQLLYTFANTTREFSQTHMQGLGKDVVPIKYKIDAGTRTFYLIILAVVSWGEFWHTMECIHDAGEIIMIGYDYIRRHGLMLCKSSKERRFIMSLQHTFSPKSNYYISYGFVINRQFICTVASAILAYTLMMYGLSLQRLIDKEIFVCGEDGACLKLRYSPRRLSVGPGLRKLEERGVDNVAIEAAVVHNSNISVLKNETEKKGKGSATLVVIGKDPPPAPEPPSPEYDKFVDDNYYPCPGGVNGKDINRFQSLRHHTATKIQYVYDYDERGTTKRRCLNPALPFTDKKMEGQLYDSYKNPVCTVFHPEDTNHRDDCGYPWIPYKNTTGVTITQPDIYLMTLNPDTAPAKGISARYFCCWKIEPDNMCGLSPGLAKDSVEKEEYITKRCAKGIRKNRNPKGLGGDCKKEYASKLHGTLPCVVPGTNSSGNPPAPPSGTKPPSPTASAITTTTPTTMKPTTTTPTTMKPTTTTPTTMKPTTTTPTTMKPTTTTPTTMKPTTTTPTTMKPTTTTPTTTTPTTTVKPKKARPPIPPPKLRPGPKKDFTKEKAYMYSCVFDGNETVYRWKTLYVLKNNGLRHLKDFEGSNDEEKCMKSGKPFNEDDKTQSKIFYEDYHKGIVCVLGSNPKYTSRDDCGNPWMRLPTPGGFLKPSVELVQVLVAPRDRRVYCCWKWEGYVTKCGLSLAKLNFGEERHNYLVSRCGTNGIGRNNGYNCMNDAALKAIMAAEGPCVDISGFL